MHSSVQTGSAKHCKHAARAHQGVGASAPCLDVQREDAVGAGGGLVERRLCHHTVGVTQE